LLGDLFEQYLKEGLDKQLVNRIPFSLLISLLVYLLLLQRDPGYSFGVASYLIAGSTLLVFLGTSYHFGRTTSNALNEGIFKADYKRFVAKMRDIYEGKGSLASDIDKIENGGFLFEAAVCGISITGFLSTMMLFALSFLRPQIELVLVGVLLTTLYVFYETIKAPLMNPGKEEQKQPAPLDLFEAYTVTNSVPRLPFRSRSLLFIASKFFAPIVHVDVPKFTFDATLVYENTELSKELKHLTNCEEVKVCLKHEEGRTLDALLDGQDINLEQVTVLASRSPKEVFPYILDSDYVYTPNEDRRWSGFSILDTVENKCVARVFLHKFRAISAKSRLSRNNERTIPEYTRTKAIQFILIGDRGYVQYFKTRIESLAARVPNEVLSVEYDFHQGR
jgi:hypothetical protein